MTTIRIDFENTNALKEWVLALDVWLRENNLTNSPRQPRSVCWRSNRGFSVFHPLAYDAIFRRFPEYPNGVTLSMTDADGDSKFELSIGQKSPLETNLDPNTGFLALMNILKDVPFMERQLECGTLVKDVLPSPMRFALANMPTYVSAMVEDLLLPREEELNDRLSRHFMRVSSSNTTKEKLLEIFSSYGVLAFVLNHIHWDTIGLRPILEPIHKHWKGLGHSSTPHSLPTSTHYVATSGTITLTSGTTTLDDPADELEVALDTLLTNLGDSEPTTITTPDPNGRGSITRWIRTSQGSELNPQAMSGYVSQAMTDYVYYSPTDFDPLP